MDQPILLPAPRSLHVQSATYLLQPGRLIVIQCQGMTQPLLHALQRLQDALRAHAGVVWQFAASLAVPDEEVGILLRIDNQREIQPQGYALRISPEGITVDASAEAGLFYAICTLTQLLEQYGRRLPALDIGDWPDFAARGVMLDVSRDKVPTMETLLALVDRLATWKINQLQLYTEHTFAYRRHPEVWANASPFTGEEILQLDAFCRERYIELVPNQNSFGHMHRWLIHPRYAGLAELHGEFTTPWGPMEGPFSLAPGDPGSIELVRSLYDELLPHFSSKLFNVGCDETLDVGQGRSRQEVADRTAGRIYLDFLLKIHQEVARRDRTMQFWGDIIMYQPELIPELPKDCIALEWGYEADHPFASHCPRFAASGIPFYVCPGTSSWCSIAGRTDNALGNLQSAAENGLAYGAVGYLITDWGDRGHWQFQPVSYLGFAAGAAYSWAWQANRDLDIPHVVSVYGFGDCTGALGRVVADLGNVYRRVGVEPPNSSVLFWVLQLGFGEWRTDIPLVDLRFDQALQAIDQALEPLVEARMQLPDAALIAEELDCAARMLRHACYRGQLLQSSDALDSAQRRRDLDQDLQRIIYDYQRLWLARNRPGGLADSVARLEKARVDYQA
jgi:hexosaminidase